MAGYAGWYAGYLDIGAAGAKASGGVTQQATVFQWPGNSGGSPAVKPTVQTAGITGLAGITGGPYATKAQAEAAAGTPGHSAAPVTPGTAVTTAGSDNGVTPSLPNPLSGLAAIGAFFSSLGLASTWVRVAKVVIGGTLVIVGLVHMTGATGTVATAARKVPLPI